MVTQPIGKQLDTLATSLRSGSDWLSPHSGSELLNYWADLAQTSGGGYIGSIDEYLNDLNYRDHLQLLIAAADGELQEWLLHQVDKFDELFIQNTTLEFTNLMKNASSINWRDPIQWWSRRAPNLQAELKLVFTTTPGS